MIEGTFAPRHLPTMPKTFLSVWKLPKVFRIFLVMIIKAWLQMKKSEFRENRNELASKKLLKRKINVRIVSTKARNWQRNKCFEPLVPFFLFLFRKMKLETLALQLWFESKSQKTSSWVLSFQKWLKNQIGSNVSLSISDSNFISKIKISSEICSKSLLNSKIRNSLSEKVEYLANSTSPHVSPYIDRYFLFSVLFFSLFFSQPSRSKKWHIKGKVLEV